MPQSQFRQLVAQVFIDLVLVMPLVLLTRKTELVAQVVCATCATNWQNCVSGTEQDVC